jgi:CubicO group peptidase (beta-lactamase class C family)
MNKYLLFLFLATLNLQGFSQKTIHGQVIHSETRQPVPYANIGIWHTEIGTLSNEDGSFSIIIPEKYFSRELIFSSVGFSSAFLKIDSIKNEAPLMVVLKEDILELEAVEIQADREKIISTQFGNGKSLLLNGQLHYDSLAAGSAMALLIDQGEADLPFVQEVSLYIAKNLAPEFKIRLRFLSVDSLTHKPTSDLINDQIIMVSDIKKGWLDFEMKENIILTDNPFYLVFEWIMDKDDREEVSRQYANYMQEYPDRVSYDTVIVEGKKLSIPKISTVVAGTVFGVSGSRKDLDSYTCYYRSNSFGEWKRSTGILSAKITLGNTPSLRQAVCPTDDLPCLINEWGEEFREKYGLTGLQISAAKNGRILASKGHGYSDTDTEKAVTNKTRFRIASVSKTITSYAIMQLVSSGKINLDSSVHVYVNAFPIKRYPLTVRQLAGHLGGIRDYYEESWDEIFIQKHYENSTAALDIFKEDSLEVKPGSQFLYSSYGYILLGAMIEQVTNQTYLDYIQKEILEPFHMNNTYGEVADSIMENKSKFYYASGEEAIPYDLSYSYPTGGLISTSNDLVNFGSVIMNVSMKDSMRFMVTSQRTSNGLPTGYGLGWYIGKDLTNKEIWYHTGELPSSGSALVIYPETGIVIALLSNSPILSDDDSYLNDIHRLAQTISLLSDLTQK